MDRKLQSAAVITAALLRNHPNPSTEKIAELLAQALSAMHVAEGMENRRIAQRSAELKINVVQRR